MDTISILALAITSMAIVLAFIGVWKLIQKPDPQTLFDAIEKRFANKQVTRKYHNDAKHLYFIYTFGGMTDEEFFQAINNLNDAS